MKHLLIYPLSIAFMALLLHTTACNKIKKDKGIIVSEPDYGTCFMPPESGQQEWVIRNQAQYNALIALTACDPSTVQAIDFNAYTLLGKYASGKCKGEFYRQVLQEDSHKMVHYNILVKDRGSCKAQFFSWNWVLVPRIPDDYEVQFKVEKK